MNQLGEDHFVFARKRYYRSHHMKHRGINQKEKLGSLLIYVSIVAFITLMYNFFALLTCMSDSRLQYIFTNQWIINKWNKVKQIKNPLPSGQIIRHSLTGCLKEVSESLKVLVLRKSLKGKSKTGELTLPKKVISLCIL